VNVYDFSHKCLTFKPSNGSTTLSLIAASDHYNFGREGSNPASTSPHELWLALDLSDSPHSKYTLRLSWPASTGAKLSLTLWSPAGLSVLLERTAKKKSSPPIRTSHLPHGRLAYARIRASNVGPFASNPKYSTEPLENKVPFNVVLEPIRYGFIPESLRGTGLFILLVALAGGLLSIPVYQYLAPLGEQSKRELQKVKEEAEKEEKRRKEKIDEALEQSSVAVQPEDPKAAKEK